MVASAPRSFANLSEVSNKVFIVGEASGLQKLAWHMADDGLVVQIYNGHAEFIAADYPQNTGCVVVDHLSGLPVLEHLKSATHRMAIIVMSNPGDIRLAVQATRAGAFDVLEKPVDPPALLMRVWDGLNSVQTTTASIQKIDRESARAIWETLTQRQREILNMIVQGRPNKLIAADLGICQRTAENHRAAIMRKMGATSVAGLIHMAVVLS